MRRLHKFVEFRVVSFLGIVCQLRSFVEDNEEIPHSRRVGAVEPARYFRNRKGALPEPSCRKVNCSRKTYFSSSPPLAL